MRQKLKLSMLSTNARYTQIHERQEKALSRIPRETWTPHWLGGKRDHLQSPSTRPTGIQTRDQQLWYQLGMFVVAPKAQAINKRQIYPDPWEVGESLVTNPEGKLNASLTRGQWDDLQLTTCERWFTTTTHERCWHCVVIDVNRYKIISISLTLMSTSEQEVVSSRAWCQSKMKDGPTWQKIWCDVISDNPMTIFMQKEEPTCIGMLEVQ